MMSVILMKQFNVDAESPESVEKMDTQQSSSWVCAELDTINQTTRIRLSALKVS